MPYLTTFKLPLSVMNEALLAINREIYNEFIDNGYCQFRMSKGPFVVLERAQRELTAVQNLLYPLLPSCQCSIS